MQRPRIQVLLDDVKLTNAVRAVLHALNADFDVASLDASPTSGPAPRDARLVLTSELRRMTNGRQQRLLSWCRFDPCATLVLGNGRMDLEPHEPFSSASAPIELVANVSAENLSGRLSAMCAWSRSAAALRREMDDVRRLERRQAALLEELGGQLREAAGLQRELASASTLIRGAELRFFHRAASVVGGDFHDVFRIDERRVAIVVTDVCGHDLAAGLFGAYLHRAFREAARLTGLEGADVLAEGLRRLNTDVLALNLSDCRFATVVYAVFDEAARCLRWARAGAPEPVLVRNGEAPCVLASRGALLGARPNADFEVREVALGPGDLVLVHTDGLSTVFENGDVHPSPVLTETPWCRSLSDRTADDAFAELARRCPRQSGPGWPSCDRTDADSCGSPTPSRHLDDVTAAVLRIPL